MRHLRHARPRLLLVFLLALGLLLSVSVIAAQETPPATPGTPEPAGPSDAAPLAGSTGGLAVVEVLPAPDTSGVTPDAVLTVIFNRPVVPLGDLDALDNLPAPVQIAPAIEGRGEWINTSIFQFRPDPAWAGGLRYTVTIPGTLTAVDGTELGESFQWGFDVQPPQITGSNPMDAAVDVPLESSVQVTFNQPMDRAAVEAGFSLFNDSTRERVSGSFEWSEDSTGLRFVPDDLLNLATRYLIVFEEARGAAGGTLTGTAGLSFSTVNPPGIISTTPENGEDSARPFGGVTLFFASPMEQESLEGKVIIEPEPWREPEYRYYAWNNELNVSFPTEPSTAYTITVQPGMADPYGNTIDTPFTFSYTTGPYDPQLNLRGSGPVSVFDAAQDATSLFISHRNVPYVDLSLHTVPLDRFINRITSEDFTYNPTRDFTPDPAQILRRWRIDSVAPQDALRYELVDLSATGPDIGDAPPSTECPGAPPTRLQVGDIAIVITDPDPVRARSFPPDGEILELLYRDYQLPVVGGPVCTGDILWWEVTLRDERRVWVAEGVGDEYFIDLQTRPASAEAAQPPPTAPAGSTDAAPGGPLAPGIYFLDVTAPDEQYDITLNQNTFAVVLTANLTVKLGIDNVTVWATDIHTGAVIPDAPITIYGENSEVIASGTTDAQGLAVIDLPRAFDLYAPRLAVLDDGTHFGLGLNGWTDGIDPWRFNASSDFYPREYHAYLYTDRPVYRPGQPVYFRGAVRSRDDVSYTPYPNSVVPIEIYDDQGELIDSRRLPLTEFGTFSGQLDLAPDAGLGFYRISVVLPEMTGRSNTTSISFGVAEYRLPEFEVDLTADTPEVARGEEVRITVDARYFFGGLVTDATVEYNVITANYFFDYDGPGGRFDFRDFSSDGGPGAFYGGSDSRVASGEGTTDANGQFVIAFDADLEDMTQSQRLTVEATITDESGQAVSGRTTVIVHQGRVYVGARPQTYVGSAGQATAFELIAVDWESQPVANQALAVDIVERRWSSVQEVDPEGRTVWTWEVEETLITEAEAVTDANGRAEVAFTPPAGGIYEAQVTTRDRAGTEVRTATTLWVAGQNYVAWRQQNSSRIDLIADSEDYAIGDTAEILITSPFQGSAEALITVERAGVLQTERVTLDSNSYVYRLPITEEHAPNVYVSVVLVKGVDENNPVAEFRMGLVQLNVDNSRKELSIDISTDTERAGPGDEVAYTVRVTDYAGNPVRAEVGVGLTDLAALSIAEPNSSPILSSFYGGRGLSVRTAMALTLNTDLVTQTIIDTIKGGGGGGGGGGGIFDIREEFVDTAYWNPSIVTGEDGTATFTVTLPDNLTTWRMDARALTTGADGLTLVGQTTSDLLSTKPLLIRPITPRFFVVGDEVSLVAIVNNNSDSAQDVEVELAASGVTLLGEAVQRASIEAGGSTRIVWPVRVEDVPNVDLTYFVQNADASLTDASKPPLGQGDERLLPVYRYEAPEVVGTGGVLREAGERVESVVLPTPAPSDGQQPTVAVTPGALTVNLSQSVAASAIDALDYLAVYPSESIETTVSRFLPNVMTLRALDQLGISDPGLRDATSRRVQIAVQRLNAQQKADGGWGWYVQDQSNPLVTAWALIGLHEASANGFPVDGGVITRAQDYLRTQFIVPGLNQPRWRLDRQVFILYALALSGQPDVARTTTLFDFLPQMSIYAKALLARTFALINPEDTTRLNTLTSGLISDATFSANGVAWQEAERDRFNWNTDTRTTAIVLGTLVQLNPQSDLIPNAVRWLMVARGSQGWETTQETAWTVMALTDYMLASGELNPGYAYGLSLNGESQLQMQANPASVLNTQTLVYDVADLLVGESNALSVQRGEGPGVLYYTAYLRTFQPVPEIEAVNRGIVVQRRYTLAYDPEGGSIDGAPVGTVVQVRLTIIAPVDLHYVVVEDPIPAGTDAVNPDLVTSQQVGTQPGLTLNDPLSFGWGWWWFSNIDFFDEKVVLNATYLPAGTYEYVYTIRTGLTGTFNVLPAVGYETYFPDVFGRSEGSVFTITEEE